MKKILLADDSVTIQKVVELTFADRGMEIVTADEGNNAIETAKEIHPDVILVDANLPGVNGYEFCRTIRNDKETENIPLLILAGAFENFDEAASQDSGANGYIVKPFRSADLISRVDDLLSQKPLDDVKSTKKKKSKKKSKDTEIFSSDDIEGSLDTELDLGSMEDFTQDSDDGILNGEALNLSEEVENIGENDEFESLIKGLGGDDETELSIAGEDFSLDEVDTFKESDDIEENSILDDAISSLDTEMDISDVSPDEAPLDMSEDINDSIEDSIAIPEDSSDIEEPSLEMSEDINASIEDSIAIPEDSSDIGEPSLEMSEEINTPIENSTAIPEDSSDIEEPSLEMSEEINTPIENSTAIPEDSSDIGVDLSLESSETEEEALEACVEKPLFESESLTEKLEDKEEAVLAPEPSASFVDGAVFPSMENWVKSLLTSKIDSIVADVVSKISHETIEERIVKKLETILEKAVVDVIGSQDFQDKCRNIAEERIAEGVSSSVKEWTSNVVNQKATDMVTEEIENFKEKLKAGI